MRTRRHQRGTSLLQALIGGLIMTIGVAGLLQFGMWLRHSADASRHRLEAAHLAQAALERMLAEPDDPTPAEGDDPPGGDMPGPTPGTRLTNTTLEVTRRVHTDPLGHLSTIGASVSWTDRHGRERGLAFDAVATTAPVWLTALASQPTRRMRPDDLLGRHRNVPIRAVDLGDGRSRLTPVGASGISYVFDNASGAMTSRCAVSVGPGGEAALEVCTPVRGLWLAGHVGFAADGPPRAAEQGYANGTAKTLDIGIRLSGNDHPEPAYDCHDDSDAAAAAGHAHVAYECAIYSTSATPGWSGRSTVVPRGDGWGPPPPVLALDAQRYRLCRYTSDDDGNGVIDNEEHPLDYVDVDRALWGQNFLVLRGDQTCPSDSARPDRSSGGIDTRAHEPGGEP